MASFSVAKVTFEVCTRSCTAEAEVTPDCLALAGTKQVRSNAVGPLGSVTAHFSFCGQGRRGDRLRRDRNLGEDNPANVQSDGKSCKVFVRLCQTWPFR